MTARQRPTRRQVEVLRAYIRAGSVAAAAYELGSSETTARQHLSGLYRRTGLSNAAQAAYMLGTGCGKHRGRVNRCRGELGIGKSTARQHLSQRYARTGCANAAQAAYHLGVAEGIQPLEEQPRSSSSGTVLDDPASRPRAALRFT